MRKLTVLLGVLAGVWLTLGLVCIAVATCCGAQGAFCHSWGASEQSSDWAHMTSGICVRWQSVRLRFEAAPNPSVPIQRSGWRVLGVSYGHLQWICGCRNASPSATVQVAVDWRPGTFVFLAGLAVVLIWRRRRARKREGFCGQCGYNLTGNLSGVCPECGAAVAKIGGGSRG